MEDDINGRKTQLKTIQIEDDLSVILDSTPNDKFWQASSAKPELGTLESQLVSIIFLNSQLHMAYLLINDHKAKMIRLCELITINTES